MSAPRILHYPGSKWSLAEWIISHMPPHTTYLEPFFGSGAVFFNKQPSALETINDLDGDVVNLFRVIRDRPGELARGIKWTPWAREEFYTSSRPGGARTNSNALGSSSSVAGRASALRQGLYPAGNAVRLQMTPTG